MCDPARSIRRSRRPTREPGIDLKPGRRWPRTRTIWSCSPFQAAARALRRFRTACSNSCRRTEIVGPKGNRTRLLDEVDVITGVSGGSFTALAYGLYGDKLFDDYEQRFPQAQCPGRAHRPRVEPAVLGETSLRKAGGAPSLRRSCTTKSSSTAPRFGDLNRGKGPMILASATDISTGSRFVLQPGHVRHHLLGPQLRCRCRAQRRHPPPCPSCSHRSPSRNYGGTATPRRPNG